MIGDPITERYLILAFGIIVIIMLTLDLGVFNKESHKISSREALIWSIVWIALGLGFGWVVYRFLGPEAGTDYLTAYIIEKALSVDNLFVFILIFGYFKVPPEYQHKVLFWGIIGAIISRGIFIFSGVWLIQITYLPPINFFGHETHLNLVLTLFGFFLVYAGIKSFRKEEDSKTDFSKSIIVRLSHRYLKFSKNYDKGNFFTIENGKRLATPLFLVVIVIEATDVLFAVDSIPAIFAVTKDPYILYSSNIFAILGLRTLYFLLANFIKLFSFLHYGMALILTFIGFKMLLADFVHIPSVISLSVVGGILCISVIISLIINIRSKQLQQ